MPTTQLQKMKTKTTWRKSSAFIWVHLGLLKPSGSGAYCGLTLDQNHQIIIIMRLLNPHAYDAIQKNETKTTWRKISALIWAHLGLLKPSSSGAYCGQTLDQNHQIIIIMTNEIRWLTIIMFKYLLLQHAIPIKIV